MVIRTEEIDPHGPQQFLRKTVDRLVKAAQTPRRKPINKHLEALSLF